MSNYREWLDANVDRLMDAEVGQEVYVRDGIRGFFAKIVRVTSARIYVKTEQMLANANSDPYIFNKKDAKRYKAKWDHDRRQEVDMFVEEQKDRIKAEKERNAKIVEIRQFLDREFNNISKPSDDFIEKLFPIAKSKNLRNDIYSKLWKKGRDDFGRWFKTGQLDKAIKHAYELVNVGGRTVDEAVDEWFTFVVEHELMDEYFDLKN